MRSRKQLARAARVLGGNKLERDRLGRFARAYLTMSSLANYRPAAPGDGCGHVYLTPEECRDPERLAEGPLKSLANGRRACHARCR
jgi:hypothetical protein